MKCEIRRPEMQIQDYPPPHFLLISEGISVHMFDMHTIGPTSVSFISLWIWTGLSDWPANNVAVSQKAADVHK